MINYLSRHRSLGPLFFIALLAAGCSQSQPSNFYTLSSLERPAGTVAEASTPAVGVGPISLPKYLDRPQIVTRSSPNKLELAEFEKWAESLDNIFTRTLADNLGVLLKTDRVAILPRRRDLPLDYQVEVDVTQFDTTTDGKTRLAARWNLFRKGGKDPLVSRESIIEIAIKTPDDFEAVVAAMSRAVESLSREIARTIQTQPSN